MLQIKSQVETIAATQEKTYTVLTNFVGRDLSGVPGLSDFQSFENGCRFKVQDGISCCLTLKEQTPYSGLVFRAETDKGISANVRFAITPAGQDSQLQATLNADVPFFLQPVVKGMIEKFAGTAMQFLKTAIEKC